MSVPTLDMHQVCSDELETGFPIVSGVTTLFPQFFQMVPQDLDVVICPLILHQPERRD